jgi:branched-subunit amino acid aminotransferase/4-amino-4-deoxychorismate lyase
VTDHVELNGEPVHLDDPSLLRATSYGHFTSMQVRDGRVRGLDLHLERLDRSSLELFGHGVAHERSRSYLRAALDRADSGDLSIRVNAFSREGAKVRDGIPVKPELLVTLTNPVESSSEPPRLRAVQHERTLPHVKHTGTFDLVHHWRQARLAGYDDALFVDRSGNVSEASIWNICFVTQGRVVWPAAAVLPGITMLILQAGLAATGVPTEVLPVPLSDVGSYDAAYLTNSIDPALPVAAIDTTRYAADPATAALLHKAHEAISTQPI